MRRLDRLCLLALLLALPAGIAHAQTCPTADFGNGAPCRTRLTESFCTMECDFSSGGPFSHACACYWDDPTNPSGFPMDTSSGAGSNCSEEHPCCWNKPCASFGTADQCSLGGGGSDFVEDNCHWNPESGQCGCRPPLVVAPALICANPPTPACNASVATQSDGGLPCDIPTDSPSNFYAPFDCVCPYLTRQEWLDQGGRGACAPPPLDHVTLYKVKTSKLGDKFVRFGSVVLTDAFQTSAPYQVTKPVRLGLPSNKNGEGVNDADTHREEFQVKPVKGGPEFAPRAVHVVNQCNDLVVDVAKPVSLLVPTAKSLTAPVVAPDPVHHNLEHFLCYQAKAETKLAKGIQVDVADQFQTRRYDLLKVTKVCNAVDKAGTPTFLSGPTKGDPKPITAAVRTTPDQHLVCYQAKLASKAIAQTGCGPTTPGDKGTTIVPAQAKHTPVTGLYVANQFGAERLDTVGVTEFCIPSSVE
jgi:hypothetical protein